MGWGIAHDGNDEEGDREVEGWKRMLVRGEGDSEVGDEVRRRVGRNDCECSFALDESWLETASNQVIHCSQQVSWVLKDLFSQKLNTYDL